MNRPGSDGGWLVRNRSGHIGLRTMTVVGIDLGWRGVTEFPNGPASSRGTTSSRTE
jgi:hypothetical protein